MDAAKKQQRQAIAPGPLVYRAGRYRTVQCVQDSAVRTGQRSAVVMGWGVHRRPECQSRKTNTRTAGKARENSTREANQTGQQSGIKWVCMCEYGSFLHCISCPSGVVQLSTADP